MKKHYLAALLALVLSLAIAAAGCGGDDEEGAPGTTGETATGPAQAASCTGTIAIMGPFTGDAASIGQEQLNFSKYAVQVFNEENGTDYKLEEVDTQLDPAQASTGAQQIVSNNEILGVVGPAGSQEIEAVGPIYTRENITFISPSATRTDLTTSGKYPTFFRDVPNDDAQGPTVGEFIANTLNAENVWIIDDQTSYSTGLAETATTSMEDAGITVDRESVSQDQNDFSALVSRVKDADAVFLPWQLANKAQVFGQQLAEQGSDAVIVGSDGLFSDDFSIKDSYVSSFAPDIKSIESSADLVAGYEAEFGEFASTFGPPAYAATNALLTAINQACTDAGGEAPAREDVADALRNVDIPESILGGPLRFDENGDPEGAQFYIFKVLGKGKYELQDN
jgi:branched-chain amino acid transport system substrate-binding protein